MRGVKTKERGWILFVLGTSYYAKFEVANDLGFPLMSIGHLKIYYF